MKTKILLIMMALSFAPSAWSQQPNAGVISPNPELFVHFPQNHVLQLPFENETVNTGKKLPLTIGYLVAIESKHEKLEIIRTLDLVDVYTLSEIHFPGNCIDFEKELQQSVFYELHSRSKTFYVELKRINNNGRFCHLSNRQFRELVKTQYLMSQNTQISAQP